MTKNFKQITTFGEILVDEDGFAYGSGDYYSIYLVDLDTGREILRYGDDYHDKGSHKLQGFFDGLKYSGVTYTCECVEELDEFA